MYNKSTLGAVWYISASGYSLSHIVQRRKIVSAIISNNMCTATLITSTREFLSVICLKEESIMYVRAVPSTQKKKETKRIQAGSTVLMEFYTPLGIMYRCGGGEKNLKKKRARKTSLAWARLNRCLPGLVLATTVHHVGSFRFHYYYFILFQ